MPESVKTVTCGICGMEMEGVVRMRMSFHRECRRMQDKGLLYSGFDSPSKDSTGKRCGGCNSVIGKGDKHAHRQGNPYHRECLI